MTSPFARRITRVLWDWLSWVLATVFVIGARYDFQLNDVLSTNVAMYTLSACVLQAALGAVGMLYRGRYRIATLEESVGLAATTGLVGGILALGFIGFVGTATFPRAVAVLTPPVALLVMAGGRVAFRAWRDRVEPSLDAEKVLIYGAGNAGYQLVRLLKQEPDSPFHVVGFIDDAKSKRNLRLLGVPVLGQHKRLLEVADKHGVTTVILSIPNAGSALVRKVSDTVEGAGIRLLVVPPVHELIGGQVRLSDIREVDVGDLLGRHQVATDVHEIAGYLTDRVVLVTGAGGSIGSELARQIHQYGPRELVLLDRDESALHAVQLSIYGQGLLDTPDIVLADIRDLERLDAVFAEHRPEVTFHAAALKHLPMLEQYPSEGWKSNVDGTLNVLRVAERYGCTRFVNISTDKAADPVSVLGSTKRLAERLTAWYAQHSGQVYLSVRFGNVLGSRGSVLHTFTQQIAAGGPVTVTHPDVTRFFMTIPEACELTIQAAAIGDPGEVLVLDMGEPVRILDVAKRLVARAGREVEIIFTGLRPGEKLHEVLVSGDEVGVIKRHPLISHVPVPPIDPAELSLPADGWQLPSPLGLVARWRQAGPIRGQGTRGSATDRVRTFLDIGAHLGETLSVVRAERWRFDRIVCFEPAPVCWPSIEALADERVTICRFGLWKEPATIALHNPGSVGASIAPDTEVVTETIDCRFEDAAAWFVEHLSDDETVFVKMNVEGAEADIVDRLAAADQLRRINHLLIHFDVRKSPTLAHREVTLRAQLDAAGIEWINADAIEFGGVYRGTRNWLLWCEADARIRNLRYRYFRRLEHSVRRRLYPLKRAMMIRKSSPNRAES